MSAAEKIKLQRDRIVELEAKRKLSLGEAAEYLTLLGTETKPKTLYNRIDKSKTDPSAAPRRTKNFQGQWEFDVADLRAWSKSKAETTEAH